ncbi:hypothetical protein [Caballeronia catudaia]|uniref:hypothetical protein n=1 Tax=Caballeronia catudaia TaxID=1777136 RepID=UPI0007727DC4|nr:hypothetical protein [Caballeronia catudaia]
MSVEYELRAVEKAIQMCQQEIEVQTDRLMRQTRDGLDASSSRRLLFTLHRNLTALKQAKQALERR